MQRLQLAVAARHAANRAASASAPNSCRLSAVRSLMSHVEAYLGCPDCQFFIALCDTNKAEFVLNCECKNILNNSTKEKCIYVCVYR